jgi:hypothetical protein
MTADPIKTMLVDALNAAHNSTEDQLAGCCPTEGGCAGLVGSNIVIGDPNRYAPGFYDHTFDADNLAATVADYFAPPTHALVVREYNFKFCGCCYATPKTTLTVQAVYVRKGRDSRSEGVQSAIRRVL